MTDKPRWRRKLSADDIKKRKKAPAPVAPAPWPDPRSREQMSEADAKSDSGKHSKNTDWLKKW